MIYFKDAVTRGLWSSPHYGTLKELLNSVLRGGKLELAKEVWACIVDKKIELNVFAWTKWILSLFSNGHGHVKEACSFFWISWIVVSCFNQIPLPSS